MKLQTRLLLATGTILVAISVVNLWSSYHAFDGLVEQEMAKEAGNIRAMLMATRRVYHKQFIDSGLPVTDQTVGFLPAHALARISQDFPNWTDSGLSFNNVSDRPRNPANRADADELQAMAWFRANPQATVHVGEIKGADGKPYYHYTTPMWIEDYCLKCHGAREAAPASIREKYAESFDYRLGDLRGVMSIKIPLSDLRARVWSMWRADSVSHLIGYAVLFLALAWLLGRTVTLRLSRLETTARQLAAGDYGRRTEAGGTDEIAALGSALNQMAEAVQRRDTDLRRFSEITAHHLQEPARRLASYADLLGRQLAGKLGDPEVQLSLDFIGQQARYQQNLLCDVQRYLAADQPLGAVQRVDTGAVVAQVVDKMAPQVAASGAQITVGTLPAVWFDAQRLGDVFEMLLDNALRHGVPGDTPARRLHIRVEGACEGSVVLLRVSDNGPGIEAQYRERVFRAFERLQAGGSDSGIGLALVRRIVESAGGRTGIDEPAGGGCSVWFELPQAQGAV